MVLVRCTAPFGASPHTIIKPIKGLSCSARKVASILLEIEVCEAAGSSIKAACVCVLFVSEKRGRAVHCAALVRKKKVRVFSLVQDTHKEINWGFL
jgi:hypothetical protein